MIFFLISALVKSLHHCFQTSNGAESFFFFLLLLFFLSWTDQSISLPAGQGRGYYCMHSPPSVICLWSIKTKENWSKGQKVIFSHLKAIPPGVFMCCYQFRGKLHEYSCITKCARPCAPLVIRSNKWFKDVHMEDVSFADKQIVSSSHAQKFVKPSKLWYF